MKVAIAMFFLMLASPVLASDGFGYQAGRAPCRYSAPTTYRSTYRSARGYYGGSRYLPRRTVTTITPTKDGGRRIETRRFYGDTKGGRMPIGRARFGR